MDSQRNCPPRRSLVVPTLLFAVLALTCAMLLLSCFVIWLAEQIHSLTLSLLITGAVMGAAAAVIYIVSLAPTLSRIKAEYEEVLAFVALLRGGYSCAVQHIKQLLHRVLGLGIASKPGK
ncbi:MAG: hypothetical protein SNI45_02570 [Rikenellaceae bacterium]